MPVVLKAKGFEAAVPVCETASVLRHCRGYITGDGLGLMLILWKTVRVCVCVCVCVCVYSMSERVSESVFVCIFAKPV